MKTNIETLINYSIQIRKYYAQVLNEKLKDMKLSPNEINILILLSNNPNITTSTELNMFLGVSKGLISRSVDGLMKKKLICLENDSLDRRIQHIFLTSDSQEIIKKLKQEIKKINENILKDIPVEDIRNMEATMIKIRNRFKDEMEV